MSVYNGAKYLRESVESILKQEDVDFEFIIINDGSSDESPLILEEYAQKDRRIHLIHQENEGLTKALIKGCSIAKGKFIARHDADDISLSDRLCCQAEMLRRDLSLSFVSSWVEVIGPEDELLLTHRRPEDPETSTYKLLFEKIGPPGHGSVMIRKMSYKKVSGYRYQFYYAQDSDLWLRLGSVGRLGYAQKVLYRYRISGESISGGKHPSKLAFAELAHECHAARKEGKSEEAIIAKAPVNDTNKEEVFLGSEAATQYFIGRCLFAQRDSRAIKYLWQCLRVRPFHVKAWIFTCAALILKWQNCLSNNKILKHY